MAASGGAGAAPMAIAVPIAAPVLVPDPPPFPAWLAARLDALGLDRAVYGAYIEGLLREEESDEERLEALRAVLAACLVRGGGPSAGPGRAGSRRSPRADEHLLPPGLPTRRRGLRPPWAGGLRGARGHLTPPSRGTSPPIPGYLTPIPGWISPFPEWFPPHWEDTLLQGLYFAPTRNPCGVLGVCSGLLLAGERFCARLGADGSSGRCSWGAQGFPSFGLPGSASWASGGDFEWKLLWQERAGQCCGAHTGVVCQESDPAGAGTDRNSRG